MQVDNSVFSVSDDYPTDSFISQTDSCSHLTMDSSSLLSVDQFMDMVCWHVYSGHIGCIELEQNCSIEIF